MYKLNWIDPPAYFLMIFLNGGNWPQGSTLHQVITELNHICLSWRFKYKTWLEYKKRPKKNRHKWEIWLLLFSTKIVSKEPRIERRVFLFFPTSQFKIISILNRSTLPCYVLWGDTCVSFRGAYFEPLTESGYIFSLYFTDINGRCKSIISKNSDVIDQPRSIAAISY